MATAFKLSNTGNALLELIWVLKDLWAMRCESIPSILPPSLHPQSAHASQVQRQAHVLELSAALEG